MRISNFCSAIQIIILNGYELNYYNLIYAFPEYLGDIVLLFDNKLVLNAIEKINKYCSFQTKIDIYKEYKKTKNNYEEIKSLPTDLFSLLCYYYLNTSNKCVENISFVLQRILNTILQNLLTTIKQQNFR